MREFYIWPHKGTNIQNVHESALQTYGQKDGLEASQGQRAWKIPLRRQHSNWRRKSNQAEKLFAKEQRKLRQAIPLRVTPSKWGPAQSNSFQPYPHDWSLCSSASSHCKTDTIGVDHQRNKKEADCEGEFWVPESGNAADIIVIPRLLAYSFLRPKIQCLQKGNANGA
jgi:hypothetical protein